MLTIHSEVQGLMASDFVYFLSSLPELAFSRPEQAPAPGDFVADCKARLSPAEASVVEAVSLRPVPGALRWTGRYKALKSWYDWMTVMLNAQVMWRARRLKCESAPFLRGEEDAFPGSLKKLSSVLELPEASQRQDGWEAMQWDRLSDLEAQHWYDFEKALLYALKVQLLAERRRRNREEGTGVMEAVLKAVTDDAERHRTLLN